MRIELDTINKQVTIKSGQTFKIAELTKLLFELNISDWSITIETTYYPYTYVPVTYTSPTYQTWDPTKYGSLSLSGQINDVKVTANTEDCR